MRGLRVVVEVGDGSAPRYDRIGHPHWSASEACWAGRGPSPTGHPDLPAHGTGHNLKVRSRPFRVSIFGHP